VTTSPTARRQKNCLLSESYRDRGNRRFHIQNATATSVAFRRRRVALSRPQPRGQPTKGDRDVTILVTAAGPASVSPPLAAGSGQSTPSPNTVVGSVLEDVVSLQEGGGSFYESTLPEVWINGY
ncbi:hypothetical protein Taro_032591, partial [Colocasia esculenta]|nr:hypothetical protein [Colocasia esculenta]